MDKIPTDSPTKKIYNFNKIDNYSFNFYGKLYTVIMLFLLYLEIYYIAWATLPVIILFLYFSITNKLKFKDKTFIAVTVITIYYTFAFVLYGKAFNFLVITYISPIILLIMLRYNKALIYLCASILIIVLATVQFDFFGIDYGAEILLEKDIFDTLFYFIVSMMAIYLIVLLTSRTKIVNDVIKDLKLKNIELEESRVALRKLQIDKESFFAIMSHEIRTPLNAIKGISDVLKNSSDCKDEQNLLELMDYSTNHLLALVNNILDFTKLNDGAYTLRYSEFNIYKSLNSLFKMNERLALEKGLEFKIETSVTLPEIVYGDKNRINQIVLNLLNNAIEYTSAGEVKMIIAGEYNLVNEKEFLLQITIADTGKGIDKDLGELLFKKYTTTSTTKDSVGLGLNISKGLIELMKGSISFESKLNEGTTFYLNIPLPIAEKSTSSIEEVENSLQSLSLNILLVDDNNINLLVLEKQLKNKLKKSQFVIARNGLEALNLIKENQYDLVLMDVVMPIMDGITATTHVRNLTEQTKKDIPIIALTANVGEKEFTECLKAGMNDFVTKPFEINSVLKIISRELKAR